MEERSCNAGTPSQTYAAAVDLTERSVTSNTCESITPAEREIVLRKFNNTAVEYPHDRMIHELFEMQAEKTPAAIALICEEQQLTYAQLNRWANHVAQGLLARGLKADERVGVYAERSVEMIVGMLAALKAGGAYVPLDPAYPSDRLAFIASDSSLVTVLTTKELMDRLPTGELPALLLNRDAEVEQNPVASGLTSRNLAYVIYTSGSTGRPKGVMIEHRSVVRLVMNADYAQIQADDCVAHCASPSFDAATWEVWAALLNGARLLIVPQRGVLSPVLLNELLVQHAVTALFLTVGLFHQYVDHLEQAFGRLGHLLTGGDVLIPSIAARVLNKAVPPRHLLNAYGPTEATTFATTYEVTKDAATADPVPIGTPIANTQAYVLDGNRTPVSIGVIGEIYIGGPGVARGYLNRPELTAERFVDDQFASTPSAKLYKTGDLGRWRMDGTLEFLGRSDYQVKVRGFRVEPGEIETALLRYPGVSQVVVIAREDEPGEKRIVAYVVIDAGRDAMPLFGEYSERPLTHRVSDPIPQMREFLLQMLPQYMVPAAFVILGELPLTPNGKVDRSKLPAPTRQRHVHQGYVPAITTTEAALTECWKQILKLDHIGTDDNFYELGGDSMMGLEIIARVADELRIDDLSVIAIFEHPTIRAMAEYIESSAAGAGTNDADKMLEHQQHSE